MDPVLRHRILLIACIAASCAILAPFAPDFLPPDRSAGFTLAFSHLGIPHASLEFAALLLPLTLLATLASVSGTTFSGIFVLGASLALFAAGFGPADGLLLRAQLPRDYSRLLLESAILASLLAAAVAFITFAAPPLKKRLPALSRFTGNELPADRSTHHGGTLHALLVTNLIAAHLADLLAVGSSPKQAIGALILAFAVGSTAAHYFVDRLLGPRAATLGTFLAPLLLPFFAYAYALFSNFGELGFTRAWFTNELPGLARILPIYYLTVGPLGAILGHALSHTPPTANDSDDQAEPQPKAP